MVPPVPSLHKPSTLPHQLAVSSGQPGSLQHAVPHQASMVDAGNGAHQRGAAAFDQGMGLGGPDQQPSLQAAAEPLRSSDLPLLPQHGSEQSTLQFGYWITVATLMIGDVAGSAHGWWFEIL